MGRRNSRFRPRGVIKAFGGRSVTTNLEEELLEECWSELCVAFIRQSQSAHDI
jgi:hypothetical protein